MNNTMAAVTVAAIMLASGAQAQDAREGPIEIKKCQTISKPGAYELVDNLVFTGHTGCLVITADFVSINLAGFSISGQHLGPGIMAAAPPVPGLLQGIAVRNGSISNFDTGIELSEASGSIIEGLRVFSNTSEGSGIVARGGIVKGNTVVAQSNGIQVTNPGTVTGNYVENSGTQGIFASQGSTVIGNTVVGNGTTGMITTGLTVVCPSNVIDNTATGSVINLSLPGNGCNNTNNVAP